MAKRKQFKIMLKARYPCCNRPAHFMVTPVVPTQKFDRRCRKCRRKWEIGTKVASWNEEMDVKMILISVVTWQEVKK